MGKTSGVIIGDERKRKKGIERKGKKKEEKYFKIEKKKCNKKSIYTKNLKRTQMCEEEFCLLPHG